MTRIICHRCHTHLYTAALPPETLLGRCCRAEDVIPVGDYPAPRDGEAIVCPTCGPHAQRIPKPVEVRWNDIML